MSYRSPIASFVRTLDFERAIINEGKGMDPFTGKFTAPVNGVYIFYFSGTARSSTYLQVCVGQNYLTLYIRFSDSKICNFDPLILIDYIFSF